MSYAIDGQQYIGLAAGKVLYTFALPGEGLDTKPAITRNVPKKSTTEASSQPKLLGVEVGAKSQ
jgi:hypothetical protein